MCWRAQTFCRNEGAVSGVLYKNNFVSDLLGSQHLLEILQASLTFKNSEKVVKSGGFKKCLRWRAPFFYIKEGYKASCVKLLMFWYITRRSVFILNIVQLILCEN